MIRSSAIPIVLERAVGDGIHSVLLVDADGELLGSCGGPPPASRNGSSEKSIWPLDAAFVGALISEVASDYRRMGEELLLLDPQLDSVRRQSSLDASSNAVSQKGVSTDMNNNSKSKDDKMTAEGANLRSLVIELDHGVVGVASAGPDFYVIALADASVQHGSLSGRLRSLGAYVRDSLSQLD